MKGKVIKIISSQYTVFTDKGIYSCPIRKKISVLRPCVGDLVEIEELNGEHVISHIYERKNYLIRPRISNIDKCYIIVSNVPEPDFILVDKLIINCLYEGIDICIVNNKMDIKKLNLSEYEKLYPVYYVSAHTGEGMAQLFESMRGKICAVAGQSGVGKSSLINHIFGNNKIKTDNISEHISRGKHTTRHIEIHTMNDVYIVDTCGFSILDTVEIKPENLRNYYEEFDSCSHECEFSSCRHLNEKNCKVKDEVGKSISPERYDRYIKIFNELIDKGKYD